MCEAGIGVLASVGKFCKGKGVGGSDGECVI